MEALSVPPEILTQRRKLSESSHAITSGRKRVAAHNILSSHKCIWPHAVGGAMTPFRKAFMNVNMCT